MGRTAVAFLIYVLGIVLAISAAAKVPADGHTWPNTLGLFAGGVLVCLVGLVAWRMGLTKVKTDGAGDAASSETLFGHLRDARRAAAEIADRWDRLDDVSLRREIDALLFGSIEPFIEDRYLIMQRYGMREGAELVLAVSAAERNFNRVWSAAADGCMPEARSSLIAALAAMDQVVASIDNMH